MARRSVRRPAPEVIVAVVAVVAAVVGTAVAGPLADTSVLNKKEKKQTKNIAKNVINSLAPTLTVAKATSSNTVGGVAPDAASISRSSAAAQCNPSASGTFTDCVGTTLTLPRSGRVMIFATGGQVSFLDFAEGDCRLEVDDATAAVPGINEVSPGEAATDNTTDEVQNGFAYSATTDVLAAGAHTFELSCDQDVGDQVVEDSSITATMVGDS